MNLFLLVTMVAYTRIVTLIMFYLLYPLLFRNTKSVRKKYHRLYPQQNISMLKNQTIFFYKIIIVKSLKYRIFHTNGVFSYFYLKTR